MNARNTEITVNTAAGPVAVDSERYSTPAADIYETPEAYVVHLDLPGVAKDSIRVRVQQGTLEVTAPVRTALPEDAHVLVREQFAEGYTRTFGLGDGVDPGSIDAQYEHGVLTLKLFKSEEQKPRMIPIR